MSNNYETKVLSEKRMKQLDCAIDAILKDNYSYPGANEKEGYYQIKVYASYDDYYRPETVAEFLKAENPRSEFEDRLYQDSWEYEEGEVEKKVFNLLEDMEEFNEGLTDTDINYVHEYLAEHVGYNYPYDHHLRQTYKVPIMLDTGDGNYDYTLNCVFPHYSQEKAQTINEKASLCWLALQQGYEKVQLEAALAQGDKANANGFLESVRVELANLPSHMGILTFLVELSLEQLLTLNELIRLQDRNGHYYDTLENPDCGSITLSKDVMCGLYDPWSGGGSVLEIELDKDVQIPIKFIRSALPDGSDGYGIDSAYGLTGKAWTYGVVKNIELSEEEIKAFLISKGYFSANSSNVSSSDENTNDIVDRKLMHEYAQKNNFLIEETEKNSEIFTFKMSF